jgi:hypothetical protein
VQIESSRELAMQNLSRTVLLVAAGSLAAALGMLWAAGRLGRQPDLLLPLDESEPVLGYDGMDQETLIDWLERAELDEETLRTVEAYESAQRRREPVLEAVRDLLE